LIRLRTKSPRGTRARIVAYRPPSISAERIQPLYPCDFASFDRPLENRLCETFRITPLAFRGGRIDFVPSQN